jgi:hypothetical protein
LAFRPCSRSGGVRSHLEDAPDLHPFLHPQHWARRKGRKREGHSLQS